MHGCVGRTLINPLTSLRFFAALSVFVYHLGSSGIIDKGIYSHFKLYQGVSFFFVLSGFVLQHTYRDNIAKIGAPAFVFLRVARVYPLHLVTMFLSLYFVFASTAWPQILANSFLLQSWGPDQSYWYGVNGVAWTLSVEMFFYACFPLVTGLAKRAPAVLLVMLIAGSVTYFMLMRVDDPTKAHAHFGVNPISRLPEFIIGMLAYELRARLTAVNISRALWTLIEIFSISLMVFANWDVPYAPTNVLLWGGVSLNMWAYEAGCAPAYALVILVFSLSHGRVADTLARPIPVVLGEISFGFYLFHPLALRFAGMAGLPNLAQICLGFATTLLFAYFGWRIIEKPAMRIAKRTVYSEGRRGFIRAVSQTSPTAM
jgi:peptidoglycan/LPS O-acetylase OafA/YrhL